MSHAIRVLIVEDSYTDAALVELELQQAGYDLVTLRVDTAAGFNAALDEAVWDIVISDYRMPAPIQDLFVNDLHRRFYQVLNRRQLDDIEVTGRNAVNSEIFAGSPSYLITAGGAPAPSHRRVRRIRRRQPSRRRQRPRRGSESPTARS